MRTCIFAEISFVWTRMLFLQLTGFPWKKTATFSLAREMNFLKFIRKELTHYQRKVVVPKTRAKPFDVETTLEEVTRAKKARVKKFHGPDSLLYSAIYPVVFTMKVFGLAPYDFTGDQLTPSNCCLLFTFAFMAIYCHIIYIVYLRFLSLQRNKAILTVVETTKVIPVHFPNLVQAISRRFLGECMFIGC